MSGAPEDDIYDDLYGDSTDVKDVTPQAPSPTEEHSQNSQLPQPPSHDARGLAGLSSLPAKPSTSSAEMSYSAQIAQQFSAYKQTPAQERQTRPPLAQPTGNIDAVDGAPDGAGNRRAVRPSEMKDEGKLFVGGLSWDTTDEGLRKYFSEFGEVEDCTILRDPDGRSRGFAFLTFKDPSSVNAVMVREHVLDGKAIDPKRAIPREEHLRNTRYFVGGLSHATTSDSMRAFFSTFGKVVDCTVMVDRETGRSKGFGFVTFEDASNTDQLVGRGDLILDDKPVEVKVAQPRNQRDQSRIGRTTRDTSFEASATPMGFQGATQPSVNSQQMSMLYQRMMGQLPMMGSGMMGMHPMGMNMGMGMGMNGGNNGMGGMMAMSPQMGDFGAMGGGMSSPMSAGMSGTMTAGRGMGVANMGGGVGANMRMGLGPIGINAPNMGVMRPFMNNAAPMLRPGMGMMGGGMAGSMSPMARGRGTPVMNAGLGPARNTMRGQHGYHPYAR